MFFNKLVPVILQNLSQHHRLDDDKFLEIEMECRESILQVFACDSDCDFVAAQILKQQLALKSIEFQRENDEKPTISAIASGAVAGTATGIGVATGGAVGATVVTSSLAVSATIATGGFVLVGVAAIALGIGVGFGVRKLVAHIQDSKQKNNVSKASSMASLKDEKKKLI